MAPVKNGISALVGLEKGFSPSALHGGTGGYGLLAPDTGARERRFMKKRTGRIKYTDEPIDLEVISDFLPPPNQLVMKEPTVKVTISLTRNSVDFFKRQAKLHHASYQTMIKKALDLYASHNRQK